MKNVKKMFGGKKTSAKPYAAPVHGRNDPADVTSNPADDDADANAAPVPNSDPEQDALASRRLSLDGDIPEEGLQPNEEKVKHEPGSEGTVVVDSSKVKIPVVVGTCGMAGWEPIKGANRRASSEVRKENQDAYCAHAPFLGKANMLFFAVFDGHGAEGRKVSHYARDSIPDVIKEKYIEFADADSLVPPDADENKRAEVNRRRYDAMKESYAAAERGLTQGVVDCDPLFSGSTGVSCWIIESELYSIWVGDSRGVLGRRAGPGKDKFKAVDLTHDQKPTRTDEKKRVRHAGARVARWRRNLGPLRVWLPRDWVPGLAMTRSIGDTILTEYGVAPVPEMTYLKLTDIDSFLVIASDGVWEFMPSQEVIDFVGKLRKDNVPASEAAESLVREAVRRWRRNEVVVDDTTACVVYLDYQDPATEKASTGIKSFFGKGGVHGEKPMQVADDGFLIPFHPKNDVSDEK